MIAEWGEIIVRVSFCNCVWNAMCPPPKNTSIIPLGGNPYVPAAVVMNSFSSWRKRISEWCWGRSTALPAVTVLLKVLWTGMQGRVTGFIQGFSDTYWTHVGLSLNSMLVKRWKLAGQSVGHSLLLTKFFCYHHIQNLSLVHLPAHCLRRSASHGKLWFLSILGALNRHCWGRHA